MKAPDIERRIRRAACLIGAGLVAQLLTLTVSHPLAFVVFLAAGCPLTAGGIVLYLMTLVAADEGKAVSAKAASKN